MKKLIVLLILLFAASTIFAQSINLGTFPVGQWFDHNYNVVWEFSSDNIKILNASGETLYNFNDKVSDFKLTVSGMQPAISFKCDEAGRTFLITAGIPETDLTLEIGSDDVPKYSVKMQKQRQSR